MEVCRAGVRAGWWNSGETRLGIPFVGEKTFGNIPEPFPMAGSGARQVALHWRWDCYKCREIMRLTVILTGSLKFVSLFESWPWQYIFLKFTAFLYFLLSTRSTGLGYVARYQRIWKRRMPGLGKIGVRSEVVLVILVHPSRLHLAIR